MNSYPCSSWGQGQSTLIVLRNYNAPESQMLHTKFHGNQTTGSDDLQRALTINGMAIILVM